MENANSQVLEWFQAERDPRLIRYLRARNNHNSEAVAEKLFRYAIVEGDATIVKALLDTGLSPDEPCCPWPAGTPWYTKDTLAKPLQLACLLGHAQLISLLVEGNAEVNTTADGGPSPIQCVLHSAVCAPNEARKRVEYLISKGATVDPPIGSLEISALALAGRSGNLQLVQYLILYGANVNHRDGDGRSVLHAAIEGGINDYRQLPIVRLLLEAGSDHSIEFMNENQIYTPMRLALQSRSLDLLQLLLQFGAMPSDDNIIELCTRRDLVFVAQALHLALTRRLPHRFSGLISGEGAISRFEYHDSLDLARWIVEMLSHDDIPPPVREGCLGNCLFTAIERQSERTAACFLQAGADTRCSLGTLIALGVMKDNSRLVDLLLRAGANPCWLSRAVQWRNLDMVKTLLDAGANLEGIIDGESYTPLVMAIKIESPELISYILDAGADVNNASATKNGHSALAMAVHKQDTELVKRLLSLGANPKDSNALLEAVTSENLNLLLILLAAANPTILKGKAKFGCSALQEAIRLWNPAFIQKLIANGVPVNEFPPRYPQDVIGGRHRLRKGNTALGIAIIEDGTQGLLVLKAILAAGGNANSVVELRPKKTALLLAIAYRNVPAVELLISAGADTGLAASNGIRHTPLQAACEKGLVQVVRKLLQLGVQVNAAPATRYGATALQFAAIGGFIGIVSLLLEHGADVNAPGAAWEGRTALEAAAEHGRIDMVHLFVNIGARIVGPGSEQYDRAREFARKRGHNALRRLLESLHATQMSNEFKI
jgi:ankyrin repeat protein